MSVTSLRDVQCLQFEGKPGGGDDGKFIKTEACTCVTQIVGPPYFYRKRGLFCASTGTLPLVQ